MPNLYDSLINELKNGMDNLVNPKSGFSDLNSQLSPIASSSPPELQESIKTFQSQFDFTTKVRDHLKAVNNSPATIQDLNTATNLVQLYFQVTQALEQLLSNLVNLLSSNPSASFDLERVRKDIRQTLDNRKELQKALKKALQQFGSAIDELGLEQLLQNSTSILNQLTNPKPSDLDALKNVIDNLIDHLENAEELFKTFNQKSEEFTGNEPDEIKQLIRNWGNAIIQIETIEKKSDIQMELGDMNNSRSAIAQSIQVHDLLEANYDYLTNLVRSGDLESAGIL